MGELSSVLEWGKVFGFPALLFAVWWLYHRQQSRHWSQILRYTGEQNVQQLNMISTNHTNMLAEVVKNYQDQMQMIRKQNEEHFELLKDLTETINYQYVIQTRIETKLDNMQPRARARSN